MTPPISAFLNSLKYVKMAACICGIVCLNLIKTLDTKYFTIIASKHKLKCYMIDNKSMSPLTAAIQLCENHWSMRLRPIQDGRHLADDTVRCIFLNENVWILIKISLNFVPKGRINNIPALVQIMAWCRRGDKPLSEPMMISLLTHICVTRPQWVT